MPTSGPGNSAAELRHCQRRSGAAPSAEPLSIARGFTLIELMVVVALIAIVTAVASLSLRDPTQAKLEQEAARLVALLESARAEARASGLAARWEPLVLQADGSGFRFSGLPPTEPMPTHWLDPATGAQVIGARAVVLGPEPLIGEQRILLRLDDQRLTLATDGLGPFTVAESGPAKP